MDSEGDVRLCPLASIEELSLVETSRDETDSDHEEEQEKGPPDRFRMVYIILMLHGIGILMPWNMFITAEDYFVQYKLNSNESDAGELQDYRKNFMSYLTIASQIPNVICSLLNFLVQFGEGSLTFRIVSCILIEITIFIGTVILAMLDSQSWTTIFFWATIGSVVVLNMANGIYQNSLYGIASILPMQYSNAVVFGSNIGGTVATVISIVSLFVSHHIRTAAIYFFISAMFVLLACLDTYFALPLVKFYRYHSQQAKKICSSNKEGSQHNPYWRIFKKASPQCFNVFFTFFVTLSIFPSMLVKVKPVDPNFPVESKYFTKFTCFLAFNVAAMTGTIFPNWIHRPSPPYLCIPVILRVLFIPCFMVCNYTPETRFMPVLISNDWVYLSMVIFLGLTNGHFSGLAMMYAPRTVDPEHAPTAGMMAAFCLVLGIFGGLCFTLAINWIVEIDIFQLFK